MPEQQPRIGRQKCPPEAQQVDPDESEKDLGKEKLGFGATALEPLLKVEKRAAPMGKGRRKLSHGIVFPYSPGIIGTPRHNTRHAPSDSIL
jgi:hypothetical protein